MKPMRPISGMTCSSAAAAFVDVSTTLPRAPRLLRRSVAPALRHGVEHRLRVGDRMHRAHARGDHVAREVALEQRADHVGQRRGRARRRRDQRVHGRVEPVVVDAVYQDRRVARERSAVLRALERGALDHDPGPGGEVAAQRPLGRVGSGVRVAERAGALHYQGHAVVAPGDASGVAGLAEHDDLLAVCADQAALLVDHVDVAHARLPEEIAVQRAVRAVFGDVLHDRLERRAHRPADVDHEAVEIVAPQVIPEHELADATQPVDTERSLGTHGLRPSPRVARRRPSYGTAPRRRVRLPAAAKVSLSTP